MDAAGDIAPENLIVAAAHPVEPHSPRAPARLPMLLAAAFVLLVLFTLADIGSDGVIVSILYAVPLVVVARAGYASKLRWVTAGLVVIVFAAYFCKWAHVLAPRATSPFNYNLVNRTLRRSGDLPVGGAAETAHFDRVSARRHRVVRIAAA